MSAAIELELNERLAQTQVRLQLFKSIVTRINAGLSSAEVVQRTLGEVHRYFPELRITYSTLSEDGLMKIGHSVAPADFQAPANLEARIDKDSELFTLLWQRETVLAPSTATDPRFRHLPGFIQQRLPAATMIASVPVLDREYGFLAFSHREVHHWSEHERATVEDMAEYLAIALRDAHAQEERKRIERHLRDVQKMEAVGRLVGGIAHDFNNLLTAMMIYCGLLETALSMENRLQRHVQEIRLAGERAASLVAQLLALTRQQVLEPKLVNINNIIESTGEMLQRLLGEQVTFTTTLARDLKSTRLDPVQIQQVILNLAINARDAMPGGGRLLIETSNFSADEKVASHFTGMAPGEYVLLRVSDTGNGMDAETQQHIFEPFFTTKERGKGSGLGLATLYGTVKQHEGYVSVQSEPQKGATFSIFLPQHGEEGTPAAGDPAGESRGVLTLLLVEDEDMVRRS